MQIPGEEKSGGHSNWRKTRKKGDKSFQLAGIMKGYAITSHDTGKFRKSVASSARGFLFLWKRDNTSGALCN